jgi:fibronectin-binding autotransporter adhesin
MVNRFTISGQPKPSQGRQLRMELLEDRQLMAILVSTPLDESDGAGVGAGTSLREAIQVANASPGADEVVFDPTVFATPQTMSLLHGDMLIEDDITITGPGRELLTIDAQLASRVFRILQDDLGEEIDVTLSGMTLTNGRVTGDNVFPSDDLNSGGAIRSFSYGILTLSGMTITGNSTQGLYGDGGGVFSKGSVVISGSTISNNTAAGDGAGGGGIKVAAGPNGSAGSVTVVDSQITGNQLTGDYGYYYFGYSGPDPYGGEIGGGGAISADGDVEIIDSSIDNNATYGVRQDGGAIFTRGNVTIEESTINNNKTTGRGSDGGAIFAMDRGGFGNELHGGNVSILSSIVTGNRTEGDHSGGGAIYSSDGDYGGDPETMASVTIDDSLISGNYTLGQSSDGGAVYGLDIIGIEATITENSTTEFDSAGGALNATRNITLTDSNVSDNHTDGIGSWGGAIAAGLDVTIATSQISNNSTSGANAVGGGIFSNNKITVTNSSVTGNYTTNEYSAGGGIAGTFLYLTASSVLDNKTSGPHSAGGGIVGFTAIITDSTISGNTTEGENSNGGGATFTHLYAYGSAIFDNTTTGSNAVGGGALAINAKIVDSTISSNTTSGTNSDGGGLWMERGSIVRSTVANNSTSGVLSPGGGIFFRPVPPDAIVPRSISNSIIAGNSVAGTEDGPDLSAGPDAVLNTSYSLIGDTSGLTASQIANISSGAGNLLNVDPLLGPLADNGGLSWTHALLGNSPAMNAGNPSFVPPPFYDQRGAGFDRVVNGRLDMGAFEVQPPAMLHGDFDQDGDVDGRDFLLWQRNTNVGALSDWQENYGGSEEVAAVSASSFASDPGDATPGLWIVNETISAGTRETRSGLQVSEVQYFAEIDRAIEQYTPVTTSVRSFGEMVARRGLRKVTR